MPNNQFDGALFHRVLNATAKESAFHIAGISHFLDLLRGNDIAQLDVLAKEWALEGIKSVIREDGKGAWWLIANLVSVELVSLEDVITQVVQLVSPGSGKVRSSCEYTHERN